MALIAPDAQEQPIQAPHLQAPTTPSTFGGGPGVEQEGQNVQKIAEATGEIASLEILRQNQTAVQEANAKLSAYHTDLLTNPQTGVLTARGPAAMTAQEEAWKAYQQKANDLTDGLSNPIQKGAFTKDALAMGDTLQQTMAIHVDSELKKHDDETFKQFNANTIDNAALLWGNPHARELAEGKLVDNATQYARRNRMTPEDTDALVLDVKGGLYKQTVNQALKERQYDAAQKIFSEHQDDMDGKTKMETKDLLDTIPKQQRALDKANQADYYKANMRDAMLNMFDGKMSLSEAQRLFKEDKLDKSDYDLLETKLSKPDAMVMRSFSVSDPETFNSIRQAQLNGSKSPGEIQRMIAEGSVDKKITPDDGKYLLKVNNDKPPTPRDKQIEGEANNLRDFGNRYFAETNFIGNPTNQDATNKQSEELVNNFYTAIDKAKASGEDIDTIRDQVKKTAMTKRFPGLGNLDKAPDVVIDIKGHVTRLLNPDQHSALKPKYRITKVGDDKEDQS